MNYQEIEKLKAVLTKMMKKGCMLMIPAYGAEGRIVSIGFRPYWTNPGDSKIEKLEINFVDNRGRVVPLCIYSIIGYEIVSFEGRSLEDAKISVLTSILMPMLRGGKRKNMILCILK